MKITRVYFLLWLKFEHTKTSLVPKQTIQKRAEHRSVPRLRETYSIKLCLKRRAHGKVVQDRIKGCTDEGVGESRTPNIIFKIARKLVKSQSCCKRNDLSIFRVPYLLIVVGQLVKTPPSSSGKYFSTTLIGSHTASKLSTKRFHAEKATREKLP